MQVVSNCGIFYFFNLLFCPRRDDIYKLIFSYKNILISRDETHTSSYHLKIDNKIEYDTRI